MRRIRLSNLGVTTICLLIIAAMGFYTGELIAMEKATTTQAAITLDFNGQLDEKDLIIQELQQKLAASNKEVNNLKWENKELKHKAQTRMQFIKEQESALNEFRSRNELYNTYEIAVMNTYNKRTPMTFDEIENVVKTCESKGIPPMLFFSIMKLESNFNPDLKSTQSSATGYMQIIEGTGRYTYETLMGNPKGSYKHSMAKDPEKNIELAATYFDYLFDKANGDVVEVVKRYSGWYSPYGIGDKYFDILNKHMAFSGYSLQKAQQDYNRLNS